MDGIGIGIVVPAPIVTLVQRDQKPAGRRGNRRGGGGYDGGGGG